MYRYIHLNTLTTLSNLSKNINLDIMVICEYATHGIIFTATNIVHKIQNIIRYLHYIKSQPGGDKSITLFYFQLKK